MQRDPQVRELLDKFVCVRIIHANGMDLSQFQFDYDHLRHAVASDGIEGRCFAGGILEGVKQSIGVALAVSEEQNSAAGETRTRLGSESAGAIRDVQREVRRQAQLRGEGGAELHSLPPSWRGIAVDSARGRTTTLGEDFIPVSIPRLWA